MKCKICGLPLNLDQSYSGFCSIKCANTKVLETSDESAECIEEEIKTKTVVKTRLNQDSSMSDKNTYEKIDAFFNKLFSKPLLLLIVVILIIIVYNQNQVLFTLNEINSTLKYGTIGTEINDIEDRSLERLIRLLSSLIDLSEKDPFTFKGLKVYQSD